MVNVFKKAKLADAYARRIKELKDKLSDADSQISNLTTRCENAHNSLDSAQDEIEKLFKKNLKLASQISELTKELDTYKQESDEKNTNGDFISKLQLEHQSYKDNIKQNKLRDFIDTVLENQPLDFDAMEPDTAQLLYSYLCCIKDLSSYMYKNGLSIRKK